MKPCTKCKGTQFDVAAVVSATDRIELGDDPNFEEFEVIDTTHYDSEWEDHSTVRCVECGNEFEYKDWENQV